MSLSVGQPLPSIELHVKDADGIDTLLLSDFAKGKKIIIFSVPGAFTPTCSARHLPSYLAQYEALKSAGFDAIICLAVNDAHVMYAWGQDQQVGDKIIMAADSHAQLADALGIAVDMGPVLGRRAARAAFIFEDGIMHHAFKEEPMVYEVSSAEYVLANS